MGVDYIFRAGVRPFAFFHSQGMPAVEFAQARQPSTKLCGSEYSGFFLDQGVPNASAPGISSIPSLQHCLRQKLENLYSAID